MFWGLCAFVAWCGGTVTLVHSIVEQIEFIICSDLISAYKLVFTLFGLKLETFVHFAKFCNEMGVITKCSRVLHLKIVFFFWTARLFCRFCRIVVGHCIYVFLPFLVLCLYSGVSYVFYFINKEIKLSFWNFEVAGCGECPYCIVTRSKKYLT